MTGRASFVGFVALAALAVTARADFVPEIPGLHPLPPGARTVGLGGAGVAAAEDASALLLNPASLALVRRSEASASLVYQRRELRSGYFGRDRSASLSSGELGSAAFVYPVPVYRGALAVGILFHRQFLFDRDLVRGGTQPGGGVEDELLEETGSLDTWTLGAATQLSPRSFVGASITLVTGALDRTSDFTYEPSGGPAYAFLGRDETDLSGFKASVGALYFPSGFLRLGFRLDLPYTVTYEGRQRVEGDPTLYRLDDDIRYPFAAAFGVAGRANRFMWTADAEFVPYSLLELNGERLRTDTRIEGYRDVAVIKAGLEYTFAAPARVRAGYRYEPDPYRLLLAEVRDDNPVEAVMEEATFVRDRHVLTGGAGVLLEGALNVDVAVEWVQSEKAATNVDQTDDATRFFVTTSYRF